MTPDQELHLKSILHTFAIQADAKYRAGQVEHGGNLWDLPVMQLIDNAIDEAVDQFVYLVTIRNKVAKMRWDLATALGKSLYNVDKRDIPDSGVDNG